MSRIKKRKFRFFNQSKRPLKNCLKIFNFCYPNLFRKEILHAFLDIRHEPSIKCEGFPSIIRHYSFFNSLQNLLAGNAPRVIRCQKFCAELKQFLMLQQLQSSDCEILFQHLDLLINKDSESCNEISPFNGQLLQHQMLVHCST